jgi:predicted nucleotidyltransferase
MRKGDYHQESDIDLFIETIKRQEINLTSFEKKLRHKIQLFKEPNIEHLPKELFNNIINGIKLSGYIKLK